MTTAGSDLLPPDPDPDEEHDWLEAQSATIRVRFEVAHPDGPTEDVAMLAVPRTGDSVMFGDDDFTVRHVAWIIGDDDIDVFVTLNP